MEANVLGSRPAGRRSLAVGITVRTLLVAAAFVFVGWSLVSIRQTVLTLFFALFATFVLEPVVTALQPRLRLGRGATATILVLGLVVLGIVIAFFLISPFVKAMGDFVDALPSIVQRDPRLVGRLVGRRPQQRAGGGSGEREADRGGDRQRCRRRDRLRRLRLHPGPHPRHGDLPDAVPDHRPAAAARRGRQPARPWRLRALPADHAGDHHRRLADNARQHRDLDHLRDDLRPLGLGARAAVPARTCLHRRLPRPHSDGRRDRGGRDHRAGRVDARA